MDGKTGLNDDLNGVERPVTFDIPDVGTEGQVVHSLAKWKRLALKRYEFKPGTGLYTDMNAIRRDEEVDNLHSIYVDQWDWENILTRPTATWGIFRTPCGTLWVPSATPLLHCGMPSRFSPLSLTGKSTSSPRRSWKTGSLT